MQSAFAKAAGRARRVLQRHDCMDLEEFDALVRRCDSEPQQAVVYTRRGRTLVLLATALTRVQVAGVLSVQTPSYLVGVVSDAAHGVLDGVCAERHVERTLFAPCTGCASALDHELTPPHVVCDAADAAHYLESFGCSHDSALPGVLADDPAARELMLPPGGVVDTMPPSHTRGWAHGLRVVRHG